MAKIMLNGVDYSALGTSDTNIAKFEYRSTISVGSGLTEKAYISPFGMQANQGFYMLICASQTTPVSGLFFVSTHGGSAPCVSQVAGNVGLGDTSVTGGYDASGAFLTVKNTSVPGQFAVLIYELVFSTK